MLLSILWDAIHIIHRVKIFNLLNESTRDLIVQHYRQTSETENCDEHDSFGGINPYKFFNSLSLLIPFHIPTAPSPATFITQVAEGTVSTFSDYFTQQTAAETPTHFTTDKMGKHKNLLYKKLIQPQPLTVIKIMMSNNTLAMSRADIIKIYIQQL